MIDIIDQIDDVTATACGWCSAKLTEDSYSGDFCNEEHQTNWHRSMTEVFIRHEPDEVILTVAIDTSRFDASLEQARVSLERFHRALESSARQTARALGIPEELLDLPSPVAPTRAERMHAALEARRHRNTGPVVPISIPKRLDGKGRR